MKRIYLLLSIVGFLLPNILVAKISLETGNYLLYTDIGATLKGMFANDISTVFVIDLLYVVLLFLAWSWREAARYRMKNWWAVCLLTFLFGLAGALPFFLYLREGARENGKAGE
jgi:hypothetical protein